MAAVAHEAVDSSADPPCDGHLDQERPPCLQRLPEAAVSIAAQVVGLHGDEANLVHLANVPEGRPVGCPAADRSAMASSSDPPRVYQHSRASGSLRCPLLSYPLAMVPPFSLDEQGRRMVT